MADPVVHFEIISSDAPTLHRFYSSVFGWRIAADNPFGYGMVDTRTPGRGINGGIGAPMQGGHGHFTVYVQVSNIDFGSVAGHYRGRADRFAQDHRAERANHGSILRSGWSSGGTDRGRYGA